MKNSKILKGILILLGLLLIILGSWRLFDPIGFFENSGLILSNEAGLLSEARGTGGVLVGFGLVILLGALYQRLSYTSTIANWSPNTLMTYTHPRRAFFNYGLELA